MQNSKRTKQEIFDHLSDQKAFHDWTQQELSSDDPLVGIAKRVAMKVYNEELTEKQKQYFSSYYFESRTMSEIAEKFRVNKIHSKPRDNRRQEKNRKGSPILCS